MWGLRPEQGTGEERRLYRGRYVFNVFSWTGSALLDRNRAGLSNQFRKNFQRMASEVGDFCAFPCRER